MKMHVLSLASSKTRFLGSSFCGNASTAARRFRQQHFADADRLFIAQQWHRNDVAEPSALPEDMDAPADEQLVEVLLAAGSGLENRLASRSSRGFPRGRFQAPSPPARRKAGCPRPVEARRALLDPVLVLDLPLVGVHEPEEHFRELDLPMEEAAIGTLGQRLDLRDQPTFFFSAQGFQEAIRGRSGQCQSGVGENGVGGFGKGEVASDQQIQNRSDSRPAAGELGRIPKPTGSLPPPSRRPSC